MADDLPFDDNSFDIVVCFNVLDHCYDPYTVIKECHRALRNSGSLLLWIHALRNKYHVFQHLLNRIDRPRPNHFTTEQIKRMAEDHFSLQSLKIVKGAGIYGYAPYNGNLKLLLANYLTENVWLNFRKM
ncbi:MAG: class I SAM-dependent methyltransferase [Thermoproteota archaeon]|nr:class I SAM-dependent methyltransferase [Thermoproteota archaeon]